MDVTVAGTFDQKTYLKKIYRELQPLSSSPGSAHAYLHTKTAVRLSHPIAHA